MPHNSPSAHLRRRLCPSARAAARRSTAHTTRPSGTPQSDRSQDWPVLHGLACSSRVDTVAEQPTLSSDTLSRTEVAQMTGERLGEQTTRRVTSFTATNHSTGWSSEVCSTRSPSPVASNNSHVSAWGITPQHSQLPEHHQIMPAPASQPVLAPENGTTTASTSESFSSHGPAHLDEAGPHRHTPPPYSAISRDSRWSVSTLPPSYELEDPTSPPPPFLSRASSPGASPILRAPRPLLPPSTVLDTRVAL
ncbi:hypothetical protein HYDPIDRAFT_25104 [Hydnomerulius pinastri MD-312]|nr:hypothetical protein HYDPIDRAFT_25104 [Hydnomerulius pinastri MD-312]